MTIVLFFGLVPYLDAEMCRFEDILMFFYVYATLKIEDFHQQSILEVVSILGLFLFLEKTTNEALIEGKDTAYIRDSFSG